MNAFEIAREASQLPHEQLSELVDRLLDLMDGPRRSEIDQAWLHEAEQRLARFDLGAEQALDGKAAMEEMRVRAGL